MSKKKKFRILQSAALGVLIASALTINAHAAVNGYVLKDAGDASKIVSFDKTALLDDYKNNAVGDSSPMFDAYMKDASNMKNFVAFNDSIKGLVSYDAVMSAYQDALLDPNTNFSIDNFTESAADANLVKDVTVGYMCNQDGSIGLVSQGTPTATIKKADTNIAGKTAVVALLSQGVDPTKYDVIVNGTKLTYDSTTGGFTGIIDGTYTVQQLQGNTIVSLSGNSTSDGYDVSDIY